jgi:hypothetical protein
LAEFCHISAESPVAELVMKFDRMLSKEQSLAEILQEAEKIKNTLVRKKGR